MRFPVRLLAETAIRMMAHPAVMAGMKYGRIRTHQKSQAHRLFWYEHIVRRHLQSQGPAGSQTVIGPLLPQERQIRPDFIPPGDAAAFFTAKRTQCLLQLFFKGKQAAVRHGIQDQSR